MLACVISFGMGDLNVNNVCPFYEGIIYSTIANSKIATAKAQGHEIPIPTSSHAKTAYFMYHKYCN